MEKALRGGLASSQRRYLQYNPAEWAVLAGSTQCLLRLARQPKGWETSATELLSILALALPAPNRAFARTSPHTNADIFRVLLAAGADMNHSASDVESEWNFTDRLLNDHTTHWVPVMKEQGVKPIIHWRHIADRGFLRLLDMLLETFPPGSEELNAALADTLISYRAQPAYAQSMDSLIAVGGRWPADRSADRLDLSLKSPQMQQEILRRLPKVNFPDTSRNHWLRLMATHGDDETWQAWTKNRRWDADNTHTVSWLDQVTPATLKRLIAVGFSPDQAWPIQPPQAFPLPPRNLWERPRLLVRHWLALTDPQLGLSPPWSPEEPGALGAALRLAIWEEPEQATCIMNHLGPAYRSLVVEVLGHLHQEIRKAYLGLQSDFNHTTKSLAVMTWTHENVPEFWMGCDPDSKQSWAKQAWPILLSHAEQNLWEHPAYEKGAKTDALVSPWLPQVLSLPQKQLISHLYRLTTPAHLTWLKWLATTDHATGAPRPSVVSPAEWLPEHLDTLRAFLREIHAPRATNPSRRPHPRIRV